MPQLKKGRRTVRLDRRRGFERGALPARDHRHRPAGGAREGARQRAGAAAMRQPTRRELVVAGAAGAFTAAVPPAYGSLLSRRPKVGPGRFRDGVATGDPTPTAVTFWSRLRTDRLRSGARLIVARDEDMRRVVATAVVPTGRGGRPHAQGARRRPQARHGVLLRLGDALQHARRWAAPARGCRRTRPSRCGSPSRPASSTRRASSRRTPTRPPRSSTSTSSSATTSTRRAARRCPATCARTARTPSTSRSYRLQVRARTGRRRPAGAAPPASGAARPRRPRGREQLQRQPAAAAAAAAHGRLPRGVRVDPARRQQARPLPDLPPRAAEHERRAVPDRHAPVPAGQRRRPAAQHPRGPRRWPGCWPR